MPVRGYRVILDMMLYGRVLKGDESALDGAGRQGWCTWVLESTALVREGEWLDV